MTPRLGHLLEIVSFLVLGFINGAIFGPRIAAHFAIRELEKLAKLGRGRGDA